MRHTDLNSTKTGLIRAPNGRKFGIMHNHHRDDDSRDSATFAGVIIALVLLLVGAGTFMSVRYQRMRAMEARELELRAREAEMRAREAELRARVAAEQARQQKSMRNEENAEAE